MLTTTVFQICLKCTLRQASCILCCLKRCLGFRWSEQKTSEVLRREVYYFVLKVTIILGSITWLSVISLTGDGSTRNYFQICMQHYTNSDEDHVWQDSIAHYFVCKEAKGTGSLNAEIHFPSSAELSRILLMYLSC